MKMMCIDNIPKSNGINLTIGKIYEIIDPDKYRDWLKYYNFDDSFKNSVIIKYDITDPVTAYLWNKELFITLAEFREQRINSILNE